VTPVRELVCSSEAAETLLASAAVSSLTVLT